MPNQSDINEAFADFLRSLDTRIIALEATVADVFHDNQEQKEAFHQKAETRFKMIYEERLKRGEKIDPQFVTKLREIHFSKKRGG